MSEMNIPYGMESIREFIEDREMEKQKKLEEEEEEEEVVYKNKVVFLRRSKAGKHLFVFDSRNDLNAGSTLIMDISEVERLIGGGTDWIKVSVLPARDAELSASGS
jgi:hypothetical protein